MTASTGTAPVDPLESLRTRLLDLTGRNRLLNYTHSRTASLRIVDELPDQLHESLIGGKEMRFVAVPEPRRNELLAAGYLEVDPETGEDRKLRNDPTAEEWARVLGIEASYELPKSSKEELEEKKHADLAIQTLLFPYELETRLRSIRTKARTAIEETGANILYLALGFLEWIEQPYGSSSPTTRLAPLFLLPAELKKGRLNRATDTYDYTLSYSGEDIVPNLSLREKLRVDFSLALPDLEDGMNPEEYLSQVQRLVLRNQPRWKVRRFATLALLNFSKLLMYLDLDPKNWPSDHDIRGHATIARLLGYETNDESPEQDNFGDCEHEIDDIADIHTNYPLIEDADSSQHGALIDAINGTNLIVEGPPGTGKSQTITNLIAAAIARGKSVLFVAEKLAALEVVKRRLDAVGLGEFCLELHSHKTQKRQLLAEVQHRLARHGHYRKPSEIDAEIERVESLKGALRRHATAVNQEWRQTGKTAHEILVAATRHRIALDLDPVSAHPAGLDGDSLTPTVLRHTRDSAQLLGEKARAVLAQVPSGETSYAAHPWAGVTNSDLQLFDFAEVQSELSGWQLSLEKLEADLENLAARMEIGRDLLPETIQQLNTVVQELHEVPALTGNEHLGALPSLAGPTLAQFCRIVDQLDEIEALLASVSKEISKDVFDDPKNAENLLAASHQLSELTGLRATLESVSECAQLIDGLETNIAAIAEHISEVTSAIGGDTGQVLNASPEGLEDFASLLELASGLRPALWGLRDDCFDADEIDDELATLQKLRSELRSKQEALGSRFNIARVPGKERLAEIKSQLERRDLLRWLSKDWRSAKKDLLSLAATAGHSTRTLKPHLGELIDFEESRRELSENKTLSKLLGAQHSGLETPIEDLVELRNWYKQVRSTFGFGFGKKSKVGDALLGLRRDQATALRRLSEGGLLGSVANAISQLDELYSKLGKSPTAGERQLSLAGCEGALAKLRVALTQALDGCQHLVAPSITVGRLSAAARDLDKACRAISAWEGPTFDADHFGGSLGLKVARGSVPSGIADAARHTAQLAKAVLGLATQPFRDFLLKEPSAEKFEHLLKARDLLQADLQAESEALDRFRKLTLLSPETWGARSKDQLTGVIQRNRVALEKPEGLGVWIDYLRIRESMTSGGFQGLIACLESGILSPAAVEKAHQLGVYDLLAREILRSNPALARFSGRTQEIVQQQYREYDSRLKRLQAQKIAWQLDKREVPAGNSTGKVSQYTDRTLLDRECEKKKRHVPIRQLVHRASGALVALKPCFMMGPMSVAQYLAPGKLKFDLVVMDEASQIKPEDALGAIARGSQLVVVGDSKQLPPTSFFDRLLAEEQEDPSAAEDAESILDAAKPLFPSRRLRWHYRSQHESLIAFSNQSFYDGSLVLFPSPHADSPEYGIRLHPVSRGHFLNRRNIEEARAIAEAVQRHLKARSEETIGVVAMNVDQREQIERLVEELAKDDPELQDALEMDQERNESLFIKNLENVQGDERDVVLISMTYGPQEAGGPVLQRFGPINSDVGWRRLNVLFTRARKRMHVFTSMAAEDVRVQPTSSTGVRALQGFLSYAATGRLDTPAEETDRPPANDFEEAVATALRAEGFESTPQVGVAGFYIDIAVRDPGNPGHFLMGIECDGATYHSAKSVRDRDRLRQTILERLGWRMRRVWSTDWFQDPHAELAPIIAELRELATKPRAASPSPESDEIAAVVEHIDSNEDEAASIARSDSSLEERLWELEESVIRPELPETPEQKRLLRPAMLAALVAHRPVSKSEFLERIPAYLRQETSAAEAKFLKQVFDIITTDQLVWEPTTKAE